jgi:HEAT repeat protein
MDTGGYRSLTRRTRLLFGIALLAGVTTLLGWLWVVRTARTPPPPEVAIPPGEHVYAGLPTSRWRDRLLQPTVSHYWPPHEFPLVDHPDPAAVPVLQDLLADPDPRVREAAVCCLGLIPSPERSVVNLLTGAAKDPEPQVRLAVLQTLARLRPAPDAAASVLRAALSDSDAAVRFQAAQGLYDLTGQAEVVLPTLIQYLRAKDGPHMEAAYRLGKMGPRAAGAVDALVERLRDDSAPPPREDAFGIPIAHSDSEHRDIIHRAVLEALGDIGPDARAAVPAIRTFLGAGNGFVRASAAVAFWKISGQAGPAVDAMVELLEKGNWYSKRWSAEGLGRMGPAAEAGVPALVKALTDADSGVRRDAAVALGGIGPKARSAVPRMVELAKKEDGPFRADIVKALIALDAKAAAEAGVLAPDPPR